MYIWSCGVVRTVVNSSVSCTPVARGEAETQQLTQVKYATATDSICSRTGAKENLTLL